MDYGERIRAAREARGLTQFDLGMMIGKRDNDVSRWERNILAPRVQILVDIAKALGVSLDYLAGVKAELDLSPNWVDPRSESPEQHLERLPEAPREGTRPRSPRRNSRSK